MSNSDTQLVQCSVCAQLQVLQVLQDNGVLACKTLFMQASCTGCKRYMHACGLRIRCIVLAQHRSTNSASVCPSTCLPAGLLR